MTREEAIAIAHSAPEVIVEVLLQLSARIEELERKIALLSRDSSNSSKPPSSDGPTAKPKARPAKKSRKRKQEVNLDIRARSGILYLWMR